ncbi:MAG: peptide-methionine (S)-S-oxide reductase MsrA, partial [Candidatus Methylomirabilales bacterium]
MGKAPDGDRIGGDTLDVATLGGGCFWCLEPIYDDVEGVTKVEVGYSGGHVEDPSYEHVSTGTTDHAEVAQVTFDPNAISFEEILRIFFSIHDPTTPNRQGADVGPQYRSAIFYHSDDQKETAERVIRELDAEGTWPAAIVTQVSPFDSYYRAEEYHQKYFAKNPQAA